LLHHYELSTICMVQNLLTWLSMKDKREVTDLVQITCWKSQLTWTSWNMFLLAFKCM
jgi:hypothetical protein